MKWLVFLLLVSVLKSEELLIYPFGNRDFIGLHFQKNEVFKHYGIGFGKNFQNERFGFGIGGVYNQKFYNLNSSKKENTFFYSHLDSLFFRIFISKGTLENKIGFSLQIHPEKQILFFRNFFPNAYSDNLALISGRNVQLKLLLTRYYGTESYNYEISFGFSGFFGNWDTTVVGKSKDSSTGFDLLVSFSFFREKQKSYILYEQNVYGENFPEPKKKIKPKKLHFPKIFSKKNYVYPLSVEELLNKKIPLREAILIHEASKDYNRYYQILKSLPKDTQVKCHLLQKQKREEYEK